MTLEELNAAMLKAYDDDRIDDATFLAGRIKNFSGEVDPQASPGEYQGNSRELTTPILEGAAFGLSDEIQGGVAAIYSKFIDIIGGGMGDSEIDANVKAPTFKQNYETVRDRIRADQDAFAEANPKVDLAAQLAGGILTGGYGGAKALGTTLAKKSPKIALPVVGAAEGAAFGFGEGEGLDDSLETAGYAAATSAIATPVLAKAFDVVGKAAQKGIATIRQRGTNKTIADLKAESEAFYDAAEASGIKIRPTTWTNFKKKLFAKFEAKGIDVVGNPKTKSESGLNKSIRRMMGKDEPTYHDIAAMRELLDDAKANKTEAVSKWAYQISDDIDSFIANLKPNQLSSGSARDLTENLTQAKSYWSRMEQAKTLSRAREKAELSRTATKDNDLDEAISTTNRAIVNPENPRKSRGMESSTIQSLKDMIIGTNKKNIYRTGAEMAPGSATRRGPAPAVGSALMALAGATTMGTAGLALGLIPLLPPLLGRVFKGFANNITRKEYDKIENAILNKNQPDIEEIIEQLYSKYKPAAGGIAAAISGKISADNADLTKSTLADMISP